MSLLSKTKSAIRLLTDSEFRYFFLGRFNHYHYGKISDREYLSRQYKYVMGGIDLNSPRTFNEKINYLKLYNRRPEYPKYVDKFLVKDFVRQKIGAEHVIPTLKKWDTVEQIHFDELPNQFVLKANHDSGSIVICKDKKNFNTHQAKKKLAKALKENYYFRNREWVYKDIQSCILAEPYLVDQRTDELRDYKFFCFNGEPKFFKVDFDRFIEHHANYYNLKKELLPYGEAAFPPIPEKVIEIPENLQEMVEYAKILSEAIPFVRVDFYDVNGIVYFGEMTFYPNAGYHKFLSREQDLEIGNMLDLSSIVIS